MFRFLRLRYGCQVIALISIDIALAYLHDNRSFAGNGTGRFICRKKSKYLHMETHLYLKEGDVHTCVKMETKVYALKWYVILLLPFIETYMHRKQISDLQYLKEQMEGLRFGKTDDVKR